MTSAKDWAQELWDIEQSCGMNQLHENESFIQHIQLDAIKEGMNRAAVVVQAWIESADRMKAPMLPWYGCKNEVLEKSVSITLKDL